MSCTSRTLPVADDAATFELVAVVGLRSIHLCTVSLAVQLIEETARLLVERTVDVLVMNMVAEEDRDSRWVQVGLMLRNMQVYAVRIQTMYFDVLNVTQTYFNNIVQLVHCFKNDPWHFKPCRILFSWKQY